MKTKRSLTEVLFQVLMIIEKNNEPEHLFENLSSIIKPDEFQDILVQFKLSQHNNDPLMFSVGSMYAMFLLGHMAGLEKYKDTN